ncbi:VCBS repeat-containing protein [candidate division TA06 bacterium]|nr:VCBS repeat-containing protein [candidate division TA06 bacterium]
MQAKFSLSYSPKTTSFKAMSSFMCFLMVFLSIAPTIQAAQYSQQRADAARLAMVENSGRVQVLDENEMKDVVGKADEGNTEGSTTATSSAGEGSAETAVNDAGTKQTESSGGGTTPVGFDAIQGSSSGSAGSSSIKDLITGFSVDKFTGTSNFTYPIEVAPGRNGMEPRINLVYNSNGPTTWCGNGWDLNLGYIVRQGADNKPPKYDGTMATTTDKFYYTANGVSQELVRVGSWEDENGWVYCFRAKIEGNFWVFDFFDYTNKYWGAYDKSGTRMLFGSNNLSRFVPRSGYAGSQVYKWMLDKVQDIHGNYMTLQYAKNSPYWVGSTWNRTPGNEIYLSRIDYTYNDNVPDANNCSVEFFRSQVLGNGDYTFFTPYYITGFAEVTDGSQWVGSKDRLSYIQVKAKGLIQRQYNLVYGASPKTSRALLQSVTVVVYEDKIGSVHYPHYPATTFEYTDPDIGQFNQIANNWQFTRNPASNKFAVFDANEDGLDDIIDLEWQYSSPNTVYTLRAYLGNGQGNFTPQTAKSWSSPGYCTPKMIVGDVDGDKTQDVCIWYFSVVSKIKTMKSDRYGGFIDCGTGFQFVDINNGQAHLADYNFDGKADLIGHNYGLNQWEKYTSNGDGTFTFAGYDGSPINTVWADINCDGWTDKCTIGAVGWATSVNAGTGLGFDSFTWASNGPSFTSGTMYGDFTGVGKLGMLYWSPATNATNPWQILTPRTQYNSFIDYLSFGTSQLLTFAGGNTDIMLSGDFDGDGKTDIAGWNGDYNGGAWDIRVHNTEAVDLLKKVTTPIRATVEVTYQNHLADAYCPMTLSMVNSVTVKDGITQNDGGVHTYTSSYSYVGAGYDQAKKQFIGFNQVRETKPDNTVMETYYYINDEWLNGRQYSAKHYDGSTLMSEITDTWAVHDFGSGVKFPYINRTVNSLVCDQGNINTASEYEYDDYGNITLERSLGNTNVTGDEVYVINRYAYNFSVWVLNKPYETIVSSDEAGTTILSGKRFMYDGTSIDGAPWKTSPTKGLLKRLEYYDSETADPDQRWLNIVDHFTYDQLGNVVTTTDAMGHSATFNYDPTGCFLTSTVNAKGHRDSTAYYGVNGESQDKGLFGQVKYYQTPNQIAGDEKTNYVYDWYGRTVKVWGPGDSEDKPTKSFEYNSFGTVGTQNTVERLKFSETSSSLSTYWTIKHFDGLGRTLQVQQGSTCVGGTNKAIRSVSLYDIAGRSWKSSLPFSQDPYVTTYNYTTSTPGVKFVTTDYDKLGRTTKVTKADGTFKQYSHYSDNGLSFVTQVTDENNNNTRSFSDAYGQVIKTEAYTNGNWTIKASFDYDLLGNLEIITDPLDRTVQLYYDSFKRKIMSIDPDRGTWSYTYDKVGNLLTQTDGRGVTTTCTYDALDRIETKTSNDGTTTYTYDTGANGIGRLASITDPSGTASFVYNSKGQLTSETHLLAGLANGLTIERTYHPDGQLASLEYPDGEVVNYSYDYWGRPTSAIGASNYVTGATYTGISQLDQATYGNNLITDYDYNPDRLWITDIKVGPSGNLGYSNYLHYQYDNAGNIYQKDYITTSLPEGSRYRFSYGYDNLYRLIQDKCTVISTGALKYEKLYSYDAVGNRTAPNNPTYSYYTGTNRLYSSDGGTTVCTYDNNGNLTGRGPLSYIYNSENRFARFVNGSNSIDYTYNSGGLMVKKVATTNDGSKSSGLPIYNGPIDAMATALIKNGNLVVEFNKGDVSVGQPLYLAVDTDQTLSSGNLFIPDAGRTGLDAAGAWEYCLVIKGLDDFGYYEKNLLQRNRGEAGAAGMEVQAADDVIRITVPLAMLGNPKQLGLSAVAGAKAKAKANLVIKGAVNIKDENASEGEESGMIFATPVQPETKGVIVTTTYYLYNESGQVLCELNSTGVITNKQYYWGGQKVAERQGSTLYYCHNDHLGSMTLMTNTSGVMAARRYYYAFGGDYLGTNLTNYRFNGKQIDASTGLYNYGARYYDVNTGRFTSPDPIIQPGSPYAYCNNNPVGYTDPTGMQAQPFIDYDGRDYQRGGGDYNVAYGCYVVKALYDDNTVGFATVYSYSVISNAQGVLFSDAQWACSRALGFAAAGNKAIADAKASKAAAVTGMTPGVAEELPRFDGKPGRENESGSAPAGSTRAGTSTANTSRVVGGKVKKTDDGNGTPPPYDHEERKLNLQSGAAIPASLTECPIFALVTAAAFVGARPVVEVFSKGGPAWHAGLELAGKENIIHIGNHVKYGVHIAIGSTGPMCAWFHLYVYPTIRVWFSK